MYAGLRASPARLPISPTLRPKIVCAPAPSRPLVSPNLPSPLPPGMSAWISCSTASPSTDSPQRWRSAAAPTRSHAYLPPHASCWHRRVHAASDRAEAGATDKQAPEPLAAAARSVGAERGREAANGVLLAHEAYAMPRVHTALARRNPLASTP